MRIRDHAAGFGLVSIVLHWSVAAGVLALFALGLWMVELSYYDRWYNDAPQLHKSFGVLLFLLVLLRIAWRAVNPRPSPPPAVPTWQHVAARLVHVLLTVLVVLVSLSGYLIPTADGRGVDVFGWFEAPAWVIPVENQEDIAGLAHRYLAWAIMLLATVHATAALKHHFLDRDDTLRRMINPKS